MKLCLTGMIDRTLISKQPISCKLDSCGLYVRRSERLSHAKLFFMMFILKLGIKFVLMETQQTYGQSGPSSLGRS